MTREDYLTGGAYAVARRGQQLSHSILNDEKVREARRLHEFKRQEIARLNRELSCAALANRYGVSTRCMERMLARETWTHVR